MLKRQINDWKKGNGADEQKEGQKIKQESTDFDETELAAVHVHHTGAALCNLL